LQDNRVLEFFPNFNGLATYFKCKREAEIDTILTFHGTSDDGVPDLSMTYEIKGTISAIRYTRQDTDLCLGIAKR
jgi:hypothetical protein